MIYSTSRIKTFQRCPRNFFYHYILKYRQIEKSPWLKKGSDIDTLLEIYDKEGFRKMYERIGEFFTDPYDLITYQELFKHYEFKYGHEKFEPSMLDGKEGNQWHYELPMTFENIQSDIRFQGYLDKLTEDRNKLAILERKSTSDNISYVAPYWMTINMDKQITGYCWAVSETVGSHVGLVIYEVLRKPSIPRTHKVKKQDVKYSYEEYREKVANAIANSKVPYITRRKLFITQEQVEEWKYDMLAVDDSIKTMQLNQRGLEANGLDGCNAWPKNQFGCSCYGGCVYLPVCNGEVNLDNYEPIRRV